DGVTQGELDEAKKSWLERRKVQRATDSALAFQLDAGLFLDRTFTWHADLEKKVAALTVNDLNAAIRKNFLPKSLVIISAWGFQEEIVIRRAGSVSDLRKTNQSRPFVSYLSMEGNGSLRSLTLPARPLA